jgi:hypothetical protein
VLNGSSKNARSTKCFTKKLSLGCDFFERVDIKRVDIKKILVMCIALRSLFLFATVPWNLHSE